MPPKMKRMARPGLEELIQTREAELESAQNGLLFWRAAADAARSSPVAWRELSKQAKKMASRCEELGRELAELRGEDWIDEPLTVH